MLRYVEDKNKTHDSAIKNILRTHNALHSDNKTHETVYLYYIEDETLKGALTLDLFWHFASVREFFYVDTSILRHLVFRAKTVFNTHCTGIKFSTPSLKHFNDFKDAGFKKTSTYSHNAEVKDHFLDCYFEELLEPCMKRDLVRVSDTPIESFESIVNKAMTQYEKTNHIDHVRDYYELAALEDSRCIGGVQTEIYKDCMYVSRIAVDPSSRNKGIGRTLMMKAIEKSRELSLSWVELGTCDFQAKGFYEKLGFKVIHTRTDNPKGYQNHTMVKSLV